MYYGEYIWKRIDRKKDDLLEHLLDVRNIDIDGMADFLQPKYPEGLHNPFLMKDMQKAVERILKAQQKDEIVGIYADYDADGIPGAVMLTEGLNSIGVTTEVYIPSRAEGYGLSNRGIELLAKKNISLLISVDLGITNKAEVEYARSSGIDVIITDHHEIIESVFPETAVAVINPKIAPYPYEGLCGAAVVWKLLYALYLSSSGIKESNLKWWLDLVALSTVADLMPLKNESRLLTKYGLTVFAKTKRLGFLAMCETAGLDLGQIDAHKIGYMIAPRLNAAGRLGDSKLAYNLLISGDIRQARKLAQELQSLNQKRQLIVNKALEEAARNINTDTAIGIVLSKWPVGIAGLLAGKLAEQYAKPVIVFTQTETGDLQGSIRSFGSISLLELLKPVIPMAKKFGGHKAAGGITIESKYWQEFLFELKKISLTDTRRELIIDSEISLNEINLDTLKALNQLEPYGVENPQPIFSSRLMVDSVRGAGRDGAHIQFMASGVRGIAFSAKDKLPFLQNNVICDLAFKLVQDKWMGRNDVQLELVDAKK